MISSRASQPLHTDATTIVRGYEDLARAEVARIIARVHRDDAIRAVLGEVAIEELPEGAFLLRRENRTVALRPGIAGELARDDLNVLVDLGIAGPAIFVNIVECQVCITPEETDLRVLQEIADQLGA